MYFISYCLTSLYSTFNALVILPPYNESVRVLILSWYKPPNSIHRHNKWVELDFISLLSLYLSPHHNLSFCSINSFVCVTLFIWLLWLEIFVNWYLIPSLFLFFFLTLSIFITLYCVCTSLSYFVSVCWYLCLFILFHACFACLFKFKFSVFP